MQKRFIIVITLFLMAITLEGCYRTMDYIIQNEPHFAGTVIEVKNDYILVDVNEEEEINSKYDNIYVSLNVEMKDSVTHFYVGDEVIVYYNGKILDEECGLADTVYAITVKNSAIINEN